MGLSSRYQVVFFNSQSMDGRTEINELARARARARSYLHYSLIQVTKDQSLNSSPKPSIYL